MPTSQCHHFGLSLNRPPAQKQIPLIRILHDHIRLPDFRATIQEPCPTPFSDQSARAQPTCDTSCCSGDAEEGGQWVPHQGYTGHKVFQPAECEYSQYTRKEILTYFQGAGVDIVVVGDSFIRQLFVRLVHLLRSQVDFHLHTKQMSKLFLHLLNCVGRANTRVKFLSLQLHCHSCRILNSPPH